MGGDVRLVKRRRMHDRIDTRKAASHHIAIRYRSDVLGEGTGDDIQSNRGVPQCWQSAHKGFPKMAGAAGYKYSH